MWWRTAFCLAAGAVLGGCLGSSPPSRFYTLSTLPPAGTGGAAPTRIIRVAPVTLPESLDRPQLVRRTGATTAKRSGSRWSPI